MQIRSIYFWAQAFQDNSLLSMLLIVTLLMMEAVGFEKTYIFETGYRTFDMLRRSRILKINRDNLHGLGLGLGLWGSRYRSSSALEYKSRGWFRVLPGSSDYSKVDLMVFPGVVKSIVDL